MDVRLTTKGQIEAHDLQTKFAVSSMAPGMKALCKFAVSNGNHIDAEGILEIGYASNKAAATNLIKAGYHYGLWDEHGVLTSEGLETANTGEVLSDEVGPLRVWSFDHETTGTVFLHAERLGLLPQADVDPKSRKSPPTLHRLSKHQSSISVHSGDSRKWKIKYKDGESSWARPDKFCTPATLSWRWTYNNGWSVDETVALAGVIKGNSKSQSEDGIQVKKTFPQSGVLNPDSKIREWLSKGRFKNGPWDSSLGGICRPYSDLSDAEKSLQFTNETMKDEIEDWDEIVLTELPLFAKNLEDASEWVLYLINEETPGYTTSDETERKMNDILERPFMCRDKDKVQQRVRKKLDSQRGDPRLQKLLNAGDDMNSIALVPDWVLSQKRNENIAVHDGSDDFTEFVRQLTQNMTGKLTTITYVNNYLHNKRVRKRLAAFFSAVRDIEPDVKIVLLTSHYPYTKNHGNNEASEEEFKSKIQNELEGDVLFMDAGKYGDDAKQCQTAHDRVILLNTTKEMWCWKVSTKGIHIKDTSPCMKVTPNELEKWFSLHYDFEQCKLKEASQ